jgi:translation initiation factor IF-2
MQPRPPIVTVMGHVDHGKTSLLDAIRRTDVAAREHGGITQHIGAYQVDIATGESRGEITFIDTPGHAAFAKMRSRGAVVTDIAVLVVAADDGVMPQTKESIQHLQAAKVPFLVALNKIDLPGAAPEKVKSQLAEAGVLVEGYGGDVVTVPVSAKTGKGIDQLLEMIALLGQMQNIEADAAGPFAGTVIESTTDSHRGPVATIIVRNGTLRVGDLIRCEAVAGKVRGLTDAGGKVVKEAGPSMPVEMTGFSAVPPVGGQVVTWSGDPVAAIQEKKPVPTVAEDEIRHLSIIIKADTAGTLEAISGALEPEVSVLARGLGDINESDVLLAKTTNSLLYGFNVRSPGSVIKLAEGEHVRILTFKIIYELLEDTQKRVLFLKNPALAEEITGKATIIAQFTAEGLPVAGCRVTEGKISRNDTAHLYRGQDLVQDVKFHSLKHIKENIMEARAGAEFGLVFSGTVDFKLGDVIASYRKLTES